MKIQMDTTGMNTKGHELYAMPDMHTVKFGCTRCEWSTEANPPDSPEQVNELLANLEPCPACPTCRGPQRETVGMVCQTCGTDYGAPADPLAELTGAEAIGVLVTQAIHQAEQERDKAQEDVAKLTVALGAMIELVERQGITWAKDTTTVELAKGLLEQVEAVESSQSPEQDRT